jgi:hypothetical protein
MQRGAAEAGVEACGVFLIEGRLLEPVRVLELQND